MWALRVWALRGMRETLWLRVRKALWVGMWRMWRMWLRQKML
jgi:hypothetical protein